MNTPPVGFLRSRVAGLAVILFAALFWTGSADAKVQSYLNNPDEWYASPEGRQIAANVLSFQSGWGGWPKNTDTADKAYTGNPLDLHPTFDNSATVDELRFLARMYRVTKDERYRTAFERGLDYVLIAQYPTGGWPQSYPADDYYHRYITFNDNAMVRLLEFVREVGSAEAYSFLAKERRDAALDSFDRGIWCILKCQIKVDGKLTAWCAQHDEIDYSPRPARSFELASLSGDESVGLVKLLMSLEHPSPQVVQSVDAAVAWFRQVTIHGIKVTKERKPEFNNKSNKEVVEDPAAPDMWARFYEIGTNKPIYSDRDGAVKYHLDEIGYERRNGYGWLGTWPKSIVAKQYDKWKAAVAKKGPSADIDPAPETARAAIALAGDQSMTDHDGWAFGFKKKLRTESAACLDLTGKAAAKRARAEDDSISDVASFGDVQPPGGALPAKERLVYLSDAWWQKALAAKPDYLLLQFNDADAASKTVADKSPTDPAQQVAEAVAKAKAKGVKPILVTALPRWRMTANNQWAPDDTALPDAVRKAAAQTQTPLIDLHALSLDYAKRNGSDALARLLHAPESGKEAEKSLPGNPDAKAAEKSAAVAQLTPEGREVFGALVAEDMRRAVPMTKGLFRQ